MKDFRVVETFQSYFAKDPNMKNLAASLIGCLFLGAFLLPLAVASERTPKAAVKPIPSDPAFAIFLDTKLLGDAMAAYDAAQIAELRFLLAHGEKTLLREHSGITSKKLFLLAWMSRPRRAINPRSSVWRRPSAA